MKADLEPQGRVDADLSVLQLPAIRSGQRNVAHKLLLTAIRPILDTKLVQMQNRLRPSRWQCQRRCGMHGTLEGEFTALGDLDSPLPSAKASYSNTCPAAVSQLKLEI